MLVRPHHAHSHEADENLGSVYFELIMNIEDAVQPGDTVAFWLG